MWLIILTQSAIMYYYCTSELKVKAAELAQTQGELSVDLTHEHKGSVCYSTKWIPCGGFWRTNFEPSCQAEVYYCSNNTSDSVVNGVRLRDIHTGYTLARHTGTHAGESVTTKTCNRGYLGKFIVYKEEDDSKIYLHAKYTGDTSNLEEYSIKWDNTEPEIESIPGDIAETSSNLGETLDDIVIQIKRNGSYTATIEWVDAYTGDRRSNSLTYQDISFPIGLELKSEGRVVDTFDIAYGERLPDIVTPSRIGYVFEGYYCGDTCYYDADGQYTGADTCLELETFELEARWTPKTYTIYYGEDMDEDGKGDLYITVTYGEEYDPIDVTGMSSYFEGYKLNGELIFDKSGNPTGVWTYDDVDGMELEISYFKPKIITDRSDSDGSEPDEKKTKVTVPISIKNESENSISDDSISNNNTDDNSRLDKNDNKRDAKGDRRNKRETNASKLEYYSDMYLNMKPETRVPENESNDVKNNNEMTKEMVSEILSNNAARGVPIRQNDLADGNKTKEDFKVIVVKTTLITLGALGIVFLGLWYYLFAYSSAKVVTFDVNSTRREIGYALLLRKGDVYKTEISKRVIGKSKTGRYEIVMTPQFLEKNRNRNIIIKIGNRLLSEVVKPVIYIKER